MSPLLFVLSMEPLLAKIRYSQKIKGIKIGEEEHKLAAFADDVLFYLTEPKTSIPNLLSLCYEYGEISNFKLNITKTKIMSINVSKIEEKSLKENHRF